MVARYSGGKFFLRRTFETHRPEVPLPLGLGLAVVVLVIIFVSVLVFFLVQQMNTSSISPSPLGLLSIATFGGVLPLFTAYLLTSNRPAGRWFLLLSAFSFFLGLDYFFGEQTFGSNLLGARLAMLLFVLLLGWWLFASRKISTFYAVLYGRLAFDAVSARVIHSAREEVFISFVRRTGPFLELIGALLIILGVVYAYGQTGGF